jgi:hypothetical protein
MYSSGESSPDDREADILLAGYAFGTMLTVVRLRGLVIDSEDMVTVVGDRAVSASKNWQLGEWAGTYSGSGL